MRAVVATAAAAAAKHRQEVEELQTRLAAAERKAEAETANALLTSQALADALGGGDVVTTVLSADLRIAEHLAAETRRTLAQERLEAQSYTEAASIVGCRAVRAGELLQESADSADKLRQRIHLLEGALAAATSEFEQATAGWVSERAGLKELLVSQGEVVAEALARAEATEAREAAAAAFTADAVGVVKESFAQYTALAASARRPLLRQGRWRY